MTNVSEMLRVRHNKDFVVPYGYQVAVWQEKYQINLIKDSKHFEILQSTLDSINFLKELGILRPEENLVVFSSYFATKRNVYNIQFEYDSKTFAPQLFDTPILRMRPYAPYCQSPDIPSLDGVDFNDLKQRVKTRFKKYDFALVSSWKPFYYLDYVTSWQVNWNEHLIQKIDNMITAGVTLNKIWFLIRFGVSQNDWEEMANLPTNWILRAYQERVVNV
jgi:hypothetical protein